MSSQPHDHQSYEAALEHARMINEDFTNRWHALIDEDLSVDQLEILSTLAGQFATDATVARYFEGHVDAVIRFRKAAEHAADPTRHAFIPDAVDLDNPYCTARDQGGTVCGLPPANGRHQ